MGKRYPTELAMNKKSFACLALAAPMLVLTACADNTPGLAFSSNWYAQTDGNIDIGNTHETLTYAVGFEAADGNDYLTYKDGTYTATLTAKSTALGDGSSSEPCYHLDTTFTVTVVYTVGGESKEYTDTVKSHVEFRDVRLALRPVRSTKTVVSHIPASMYAPETLDKACNEYSYTYSTEYDTECTKATIKTKYTAPERDEQTYEVQLSGGGTYLDNEQILFAMRGLDMKSAVRFRSVNPVSRNVSTLSMTATPASETYKSTFSVGDEAAKEHELTAYTFSLGYGGSNPGQPQKLTYAAVTSTSDNTYRNVMLRMETPVIYSLGTLVYTLTAAQFS